MRILSTVLLLVFTFQSAPIPWQLFHPSQASQNCCGRKICRCTHAKEAICDLKAKKAAEESVKVLAPEGPRIKPYACHGKHKESNATPNLIGWAAAGYSAEFSLPRAGLPRELSIKLSNLVPTIISPPPEHRLLV